MRRVVRSFVWLLVIVGFSVLIALFFEQNKENLQFQYFSYQTPDLPKGIVAALFILAGVALSGIIFLGVVVSKVMEVRRLRRENTSLQRLLDLHSSKPAGLEEATEMISRPKI